MKHYRILLFVSIFILSQFNQLFGESNSKKLFLFDNIKEMLTSKELYEGCLAETKGYEKPDDGGAGKYQISKQTEECFLQLNNGLYANYIIENERINLKALGVVSSKKIDNYDRLFEITHQIKSNRTLFLPKGYYILSDCIFLPPNTTLQGEGEDSVIYFNGKYSYMGVGLSNGGDNVTITNLKINHKQSSNNIVSGSMLGGIGFSTIAFESIINKHDFKNLTKQNTKNLKAINIWSDCNYILQTEPLGNYGITDVEYRNIVANNSLVSIYPRKDNGYIKRVILDNINCSSCRIGVGLRNGYDIHLSNIWCKNLRLTENSIWVNNCIIDTDINNNLDKKYAISALLIGNGKYYIDNMTIKGGNVNQSKAVLIYDGSVYMNNSVIEPANFNKIWSSGGKNNYNAHFENCDFKGANINVLSGSAKKCNAKFVKNKNFNIK